MKNIKGISLIEVLLALVISSLVLVGIYSIFISSRHYLHYADVQSFLQLNYRLAIRKVQTELQQSSPDWIIIDQNNPQVGSDEVTYRILPDADDNGVPDYTAEGLPDWDNGTDYSIRVEPGTTDLIRSQGIDTYTIARDVKSIRFIDHAINPALYLHELNIVIELEIIDLTGKIHNITMSSIINIRN